MKIPEDMQVGRMFDTKAFGIVRIVDYHNCDKVTVEFLSSGFVSSFNAGNVRSGEIKDKSRIERKIKDGDLIISKKYGIVLVLKCFIGNIACIQFKETGYTTVARIDSIVNDNVIDRLARSVYGVGFLGIGDFNSLSLDRMPYKSWSRMLERCYSDRWQEKKPTYKGCTVCKEWHNFQNFAKWYVLNYPKDGKSYQLDKDLAAYGDRGKVYSPETCVFVSAQVNTEESHAKSYKFMSPSGGIVDIYNMAKFCRDHGLNKSKMAAINAGRMLSYNGWTKAN